MVVIETNINIDFNGDCNSSEFSNSIDLSNESNEFNIGKSIKTSIGKSRSKSLNGSKSKCLFKSKIRSNYEERQSLGN